MNFDEQMSFYISLVEKRLSDYKLSGDCEQSKLFESVNYSLFSCGKRLRPVIMLASCYAAGGNINDAIDFSAALEMIHTSSLIHDDLPAMDNDDLRRGMPTNHRKFGEATAILAGDVLLVKPFEVMAESVRTKGQLSAMSYIAKCAGACGMMGGQQIDLDSESKKCNEKTIVILNELKTGALFKAAVLSGIYIANGSEEMIKSGMVYAENLGLAFQLTDDLLDNDPSADTGKTKGSDIDNNKCTYLSVYGEKKCRELINKCTSDAVNAAETFGEKGWFLKELAEKLAKRIR